MRKTVLFLFAILLLIALVCGLKLFVIGEPTDADTLAIRVDEGDGQLAIYVQSMDSAMAISNMQYHYDGTVMQITVWKVLSSPLNRDGDICLYYEIMDETEIWLGGKRIWSAK